MFLIISDVPPHPESSWKRTLRESAFFRLDELMKNVEDIGKRTGASASEAVKTAIGLERVDVFIFSIPEGTMLDGYNRKLVDVVEEAYPNATHSRRYRFDNGWMAPY